MNTTSAWIGLRYHRGQQQKRFFSVLTWISLISMMIGVMALIVVLSVINGFQAETRDRLLRLLAHGEYIAEQPLTEQQAAHIQSSVLKHDGVEAASVMLNMDAMIIHEHRMQAVSLDGLSRATESPYVAVDVNRYVVAGEMTSLQTQPYRIVLGAGLAHALQVNINDRVTVMLPQLTITPFGPKPRRKPFIVSAIFQVGTDMDANQAYISMKAAQQLARFGDKVQGVRVRVADPIKGIHQVAKQTDEIINTLGMPLAFITWNQKRSPLFKAIKMEKIMVTLMLSMVIAIAVFNLLAVLSMAVAKRRKAIAVLRIMGMKKTQVLTIFFVHGMSLSLLSLCIGGLLGIVVSIHLSDWVYAMERTLGFYVFDPSVFYISGLPSVLDWHDVLWVSGYNLVLSALFVLYPAYKAAQIKPVEAMQYS